MRIFAGTIAAVLALAVIPDATAQLRKCVGKDGKPVYQDAPCASGALAPMSTEIKARQVPELSRERQVIAHGCLHRWRREVSPDARVSRVDAIQDNMSIGDPVLRQRLAQSEAGTRMLDAATAAPPEAVRKFNAECVGVGFQQAQPSNDGYNERYARELKRVMDAKYPESEDAYRRLAPYQ